MFLEYNLCPPYLGKVLNWHNYYGNLNILKSKNGFELAVSGWGYPEVSKGFKLELEHPRVQSYNYTAELQLEPYMVGLHHS